NGLNLSNTQGGVDQWNPVKSYQWTLATTTGTITPGLSGLITLNTGNFTSNNVIGNGSFSVTQDTNHVFLNFAGSTAIYWDTNSTAAGAGNPADGTWSNSGNPNWTFDPAGSSTTLDWFSGGDAIFSAGTD